MSCGEIFNVHFVANLLLTVPVSEFWKKIGEYLVQLGYNKKLSAYISTTLFSIQKV